MGNSILLVDDDTDFRDAVAEVLESNGYDVTTARDGFAAMKKLHERDFGLMLSDMIMPDMNGAQLVEYAHRVRPRTRAIIVSGQATDASKERFRLLGVDGFIEKPVHMERLTSMVRAHLSSPASGPQRRTRRVLVADDNTEFRCSIAEYLTERGFVVTTVCSGKAAMQKLGGSEHYDGVVLDHNMPGMKGGSTIAAVRDMCPGARIVLTSGEALAGEVREAMRCGAHHFLAKPFPMESLVSILNGDSDTTTAGSPVVRVVHRERPLQAPELDDWRSRWMVRVRRLPLATCGIVVLLMTTIMLLMSTPRPQAYAETVEGKLDRLIKAVELDWGR